MGDPLNIEFCINETLADLLCTRNIHRELTVNEIEVSDLIGLDVVAKLVHHLLWGFIERSKGTRTAVGALLHAPFRRHHPHVTIATELPMPAQSLFLETEKFIHRKQIKRRHCEFAHRLKLRCPGISQLITLLQHHPGRLADVASLAKFLDCFSKGVFDFRLSKVGSREAEQLNRFFRINRGRTNDSNCRIF